MTPGFSGADRANVVNVPRSCGALGFSLQRPEQGSQAHWFLFRSGLPSAIGLSLLAACSTPSPAAPPLADAIACPGMVPQALFNAALGESYLGLTAVQMAAVVKVFDADRP